MKVCCKPVNNEDHICEVHFYCQGDDASDERMINGGWRKCVTDSEMLIVSFDRFGEHGSITQVKS